MLCTTTVQNFRSFGLQTARTFSFKFVPSFCSKPGMILFTFFFIMANQNKLTSFSHVLYPYHWLIMGGFPAKIDQSLVFPLCFQGSKSEHFCLFVISNSKSFASQKLKFVGLLGRKCDFFFISSGSDIQSDFDYKTSKMKLYSVRTLKPYVN